MKIRRFDVGFFPTGLFFILFCLVALLAVLQHPLEARAQNQSSSTDLHSALRKALTFYASFDGQVDADFALGDPTLYTAPSMEQSDEGTPGLPGDNLARRVEGEGRFGDALRIDKQSEPIIYFKAGENMAYQRESWDGTISFWLSLNPDKDLSPGYSDPLLITSRSWNDASLFVDFTKDDHPRHFRFAAFADLQVWNPSQQEWSEVPPAKRPMVEVTQPPFERGKWTHVVMTFTNFNTGRKNGVLTCYLNGTHYGTLANRKQTITWKPEKALMSLGIDYTGGFDEFSVFNRALTEREVEALYQLESGVKSLLSSQSQSVDQN